MRILGIETSCDETSVAILEWDRRTFRVLANTVYSQVQTHAKTGGVVPEVAAREHCIKIVPVIDEAFRTAGVAQGDVDAIAVTAGPGLVTALLVGVEAARTLAYLWQKPLIPVNHIEAHAVANVLTNKPITYPALCLVVSGGHTELLVMKRAGEFQCVGRTVDDAVGEAFDKVAKLMKLGYPGGPAVSRLAESGDRYRYHLPRPMMHSKDLNFSFSGIKTAVLYLVEGIPGHHHTPERIVPQDLAASFQQAAIDVLVAKTLAAAKKYGCKSVLLAGGVAANKELRAQLGKAVTDHMPQASYHQPALEFCTDNAGMIAARGAQLFAKKQDWPWAKVQADPNWETW